MYSMNTALRTRCFGVQSDRRLAIFVRGLTTVADRSLVAGTENFKMNTLCPNTSTN